MSAPSASHGLRRFAVGAAAITSASVVAVAATLAVQAKMARRVIGQPFGEHGPAVEGIYGAGPGSPITVGALGDSTAAGLGAEVGAHTATGVVAAGLAALAGRPVKLVSAAQVGASSTDLADQVSMLLRRAPALELAIILVGANDVTHLRPMSESTDALAEAVVRLRAVGAEVIVGTCPDLGTLRPVPRPLRWIARHASRRLAAAQTVAVIQRGGRTVSMGDLLGPEFEARPQDLFSHDKFHPSAAGYARCGAALLPTAAAAVRLRLDTPGVDDDTSSVTPVAQAAANASAHAGVEVSAVPAPGGRGGALARIALRRRQSLARNTSPTSGEPST